MAARTRAIHRKGRRACRRSLRSHELRRSTLSEVRKNISASRTKQEIRTESLLRRSQGLGQHGYIWHSPFHVDSPSIRKSPGQEPLGLGDPNSGTQLVRVWAIRELADFHLVGISWSAKLPVGRNSIENCASAPTSDENICRGAPKGTATPSAPRVVIQVFEDVALICGGWGQILGIR